MPLLSKELKENGFSKASAINDRYLNPSQINEGDKCRVTFLGDDSAIGYEVWVDGPEKNISLRFKDEPTRSDIEERCSEAGGKFKRNAETGEEEVLVKRFMVFAVWNYQTETVQVFQFSQSSLATPIISYLSDEEIEAEPHLYDFVISKTKVGPLPRDVRYEVAALPGRRRKADVNKQVETAWKKVTDESFNLQAVISGGDPFNSPF